MHQPSQLTALKATDGMPLCGFNSTEVKPAFKQDLQVTPSPDDYLEIRTLEKRVAEKAPVGKLGVFGTTSERAKAMTWMPRETVSPDPGAYRQRKAMLKKGRFGAGLVSGTNRFARDCPVGEPEVDWHGTPSPDAYDPTHVPNYRCQFRRPKTEHLSFGSSAGRWKPTEVFVGQPYRPDPGPGQYTPSTKTQERHVGGAAVTSEDRGLQPNAGELLVGPRAGVLRSVSIPGRSRGAQDTAAPGSYNTEGSMRKSTFNVTAEDAANRSIMSGTGNLSMSLQEASVMSTDSFASLHASAASLVGGAGGGAAGTRARLGARPGLSRSFPPGAGSSQQDFSATGGAAPSQPRKLACNKASKKAAAAGPEASAAEAAAEPAP